MASFTIWPDEEMACAVESSSRAASITVGRKATAAGQLLVAVDSTPGEHAHPEAPLQTIACVGYDVLTGRGKGLVRRPVDDHLTQLVS